MNLVFIYLGEECLVIIYSASELAMGIFDVILQPENMYQNLIPFFNQQMAQSGPTKSNMSFRNIAFLAD